MNRDQQGSGWGSVWQRTEVSRAENERSIGQRTGASRAEDTDHWGKGQGLKKAANGGNMVEDRVSRVEERGQSVGRRTGCQQGGEQGSVGQRTRVSRGISRAVYWGSAGQCTGGP